MAKSNRDQVQQAMFWLRDGLFPFMKREMEAVYGDDWFVKAIYHLTDAGTEEATEDAEDWDAQAIFRVMIREWNSVFRRVLGPSDRSLVHELWDARKDWAHQRSFSTDDAYRVLDSAERLLKSVAAPQSTEAEEAKQELLRRRFDEATRRNERKAAQERIKSEAAGGYKPWREVITPHPDVVTGDLKKAEFAADLWLVANGRGSDEYRDPVEFYRRTYLTEGITRLLRAGLERVTGRGGDPVVELQTNFGGGKTHSMLAVYHLFSEVSASSLPGMEELLKELEIDHLPAVKRAVLVGNKIPPAEVHVKPDGTRVHTLWGELAWQIGGKEGYEIVRRADETATNPGDRLAELFLRFGPCVILIDEWISYARQLHEDSKLPAGTFDTHFTFAQTLTEEVKNSPNSFLIVSLPESDNEIGGQRGREALDRLKNAVGRVESSWRPASAEEGFEIVRRRLFQPIHGQENYQARDAVCRAFSRFYQEQPAEFPSECREGDYERRLKAAYPIHPELFDRLYNDWSTIDKFQRTRGVLRLMASVIRALWERDDKNLLILPAMVPIDDSMVHSEVTNYLDPPWVSIIDQDVDGPHGLPRKIDQENANLGRFSAARRVARTVFLGSAPKADAANRGIDELRIKLGCAQPGESPAIFGDALRRLTERATYLYVDRSSYWYSTQATVNRLAEDRAEQVQQDDVFVELRARLRVAFRDRGDFTRVHICPQSGSDVLDEKSARLVVLDPEYPHDKTEQSLARAAAQEILNSRGSGDRSYKNTLVFAAADKTRLAELISAARKYLAWQSIVRDKVSLNLDPFQASQAEDQLQGHEEALRTRVYETYQWLLVPEQLPGEPGIMWDTTAVPRTDNIVDAMSKRLISNEALVTRMVGTILRMHLDNIPLWEGDYVHLQKLEDYFFRYLYLPRLKNPEVLLNAIVDGLRNLAWSEETFAYADRWDPQKERYAGLQVGAQTQVQITSSSLLVKPDAALAQMHSGEQTSEIIVDEPPLKPPAPYDPEDPRPPTPGTPRPPAPARKKTRFYGSVKLSPLSASNDLESIIDGVIQHLASVVGSEVTLTLDIEGLISEGIDAGLEMTLKENAQTLGFDQVGIDE